jgi:FkbM family methyltransferase
MSQTRKKITRTLHLIILRLGFDNIVATINKRLPIVKLVPLPADYSEFEVSEKKVKRDSVNFILDPRDYMQWFVFANMKDYSWMYAYALTRNIPNPVIYDVGANIGAFALKLSAALQASNISARVHTFEPSKTIYSRLIANQQLNETALIKIINHNIAISDCDGLMHLSNSVENSGAGRLINGTQVSDDDQKITGAILPGHQVKVRSLDSLSSEIEIEAVDFIKIDVEGFEPHVIMGAVEIIQKNKPSLYMEITPKWFLENGVSTKKFVRDLHEMGYSLFLDGNGSLIDYEVHMIDSFIQFNVLAVHRENKFRSGLCNYLSNQNPKVF